MRIDNNLKMYTFDILFHSLVAASKNSCFGNSEHMRAGPVI
jgi:hypothetical protein